MKKGFLSVFTVAIAIALALPQGSIKAQPNTGQDTPAEEPPQPASQQLDYRTPQQIFQRRVNNATITCDASNSASCERVTPALESLDKNETLIKIREARQATEDR